MAFEIVECKSQTQEQLHGPALNPIDILLKELESCNLSEKLFGGAAIHVVCVPGAEGIIPQFPPAPITPGTETFLLGRMINLLGNNDINTSTAFMQTTVVSGISDIYSNTAPSYALLESGNQMLVKYMYPYDIFGRNEGLSDAAGLIYLNCRINTRSQDVKIDVASPEWSERVYSGIGFVTLKSPPSITQQNYQIVNLKSTLDLSDNPIDSYVQIPIDITSRLRTSTDPRLAFRITLSGTSVETKKFHMFTRWTSETVSGVVLTPSISLSTPKLTRRAFGPEDYWRAFTRDNIIKMRGRDDDSSVYVYTGGTLTRIPVADVNLSDPNLRIGADQTVQIDEVIPDDAISQGSSLDISLNSTTNLSRAAVVKIRFPSPMFTQPISTKLRFYAQNLSTSDSLNVRVFRIDSFSGRNFDISKSYWNLFANQQLTLIKSHTVPKNMGTFIYADFTKFYEDRTRDIYFLIDTDTSGGTGQISSRSSLTQVDGLFTMPFVIVTWQHEGEPV